MATLEGLTDRARTAGAGHLTIVGTAPLRRLADAPAVVRDAGRLAGTAVHALGQEEEGLLTLLGVTGGQPVRDRLVVVDIGGGSTELVALDDGAQARAIGLPIGAASLTAAHVRHDPVSAEEQIALRSAARAALDRAWLAGVDRIVAVGGTASNLLKLVAGGATEGRLTAASLVEAGWALAAGNAESVAAARGLRPARVRLLPAGAAILGATLERSGLDAVEVLDRGVREGTILAVDRGGACWRDWLAQGGATGPTRRAGA